MVGRQPFSRGEDIHLATAARVFETSPADVSDGQRRFAKVINFGVLYGMEAYGLAQRLEIATEEAKEHIDAYFAQFPDVRDFLSGIVTAAKDTGYTTTLLGRRRYLPELSSTNFRDRQMGERMALNAPIQGSAADIIKKAMVALDAELRSDPGADLLLQVHDELVLEADEAEAERISELTAGIMEGVVALKVPHYDRSSDGRIRPESGAPAESDTISDRRPGQALSAAGAAPAPR